MNHSNPVSRIDPDLTRPPAPSDSAIRAIGPYRLLQKLGEGGMGEVWLAEQTQPVRRQVALKVIKAGMDTAQVVARFEAERQALALMDHPNIAKVFDGGSTAEGRPYFVMEHVRGEPITDYCDRVKMPLRERLELFAGLCEGVQHAHQKGIIHRDLKPSNVLVSIGDDRAVPRIIDFGIAKATGHRLTDAPLHTEIGSLVGTPEYMSPEQADMTLDVDTRTDVYSLGMMLYELLTGTLPFDTMALRSAGAEEMRRVIREKPPRKPSTRVRDLGDGANQVAEHRSTNPSRLPAALRGDLDWIVLKAIDKDRTRRYATANALALDIRRHLHREPVSAGPPTAAYRTRKFVQRNRAAVAATAAGLSILLALVAVLALQTLRLAHERDRVTLEASTATEVTRFLISLFSVADPSQSRGNALTAREVLERGVGQLETGLRDQPRLRSRLLTTIGTVYTNLGLYAEAAPLIEQAVTTSTTQLGEGDPDSVAAVNALATLSWYRGEYPRAATLYESVVADHSKRYGPADTRTLKAQFDLASAYSSGGKYAEAERLLLPTLARQRQTLGATHPDVLSSLNNLQNLYFIQHRYSEALVINEEVVAARERLLGPDHPQTLTALHNLATIHHEMGQLSQAEHACRSALAGRRKVLGDRHPSTLRTWLRLARVLASSGRADEAARELRTILAAIGGDLQAPYPVLRDEAHKHLRTLRP